MALWNILLLALLFITVGFISGALVTLVFYSHKAVEKTSPERRTDEANRRGLQNLVNLYRERGSGRLVLEAGKKFYSNQSELSKGELEILSSLAQEWLAWSIESENISTRLDTVIASSESFAETESKYHPNENREFSPINSPGQTPAVKPKNEEKTSDKKDKRPPATIVEQINEILQERLARSPLEERGIKLTEDPDKGVIVWIGTDRFSGIDAIPDMDVKAEIRAAVETWEKNLENHRL